ncbi:adenylate/guanylate cyclase domain-containing protein [Piscinibacter sakaiensis]|uniref:adenylate/guanylate cyclase domain-containing protein n=1 Tax=Piscinibacter sakaiensis TaxID=1547922 RepID=UPI003AAE3D79
MSTLAEKTVLFADLRGSTGLFERLGNTQATHVVTSCVASLGAAVELCGGTVIKTLGDGLMASFAAATPAVRAARAMQQALQQPAQRAGAAGAGLPGRRPRLKLQVALACGEVVEMDNDCFGDAVNVAARLLDHAGDNEILVTEDVVAALSPSAQRRFRSLSQIPLRGRSEPVHVLLMATRGAGDFAATRLAAAEPVAAPPAIRLSWLGRDQLFTPPLPRLMLGRSPQASCRIDDARASRLHARIDWHGATLLFSDLSCNGSYVRFDHDPEVVALRRGRCTLHGSGSIGLGSSPNDEPAAAIRFEVLHRSGSAQPVAAAASAVRADAGIALA